MSLTQRFIRFAFGTTGTRTAIPDPVQGDGSVSYQDGYNLNYQRQKTDPLSRNIERDKMNQLFYDLSLNQQQYQLNGVPEFVPAADNGGVAVSYPLGARVLYTDGAVYLSLVAANVVLPGSDPTKWRRVYGVPIMAAAAGTADALTAAPLPAVLVLVDQLPMQVRALLANATTTPTLAVNATAAKTIVKGNNLPLAVGDIAGAGHWLSLVYDLTLDKYVLLNPASSVTGKSLQRFTANGNFTVPAGVTTIWVSGCAGGGGGGNGGSGTSAIAAAGSGGGAGQPIIRQPFAVVPGAVIALTIGAGGAAGGNGGNTVIGALITLTAGGAGQVGANVVSPASGANGGAGFPNGEFSPDQVSNSGGCVGGTGGSGPFGGGGPGGRSGTGSGANGTAAAGFGSGGGGGGGYYIPGVGTGGAGSAGAPGLVIIEW